MIFQGTIDNMSIWDRELTTEEIDTLSDGHWHVITHTFEGNHISVAVKRNDIKSDRLPEELFRI